jgi:hemerythrin-like domain-containing protein
MQPTSWQHQRVKRNRGRQTLIADTAVGYNIGIMVERETERVIAWAVEMRRMHEKLRHALDVVRGELDGPNCLSSESIDNLLVYCYGFCTALDGHHSGEDRILFPSIERAHPGLAPALRTLRQDHSMISHLIRGLRAAGERSAEPGVLNQHLEGIAALMENHFRYEERLLTTVLEGLALDATVVEALGPL